MTILQDLKHPDYVSNSLRPTFGKDIRDAVFFKFNLNIHIILYIIEI